MCVICVKRAGVEPPDRATIETMFENNRDGAGVAYCKRGARIVAGVKGFSRVEEFEACLNDLDIKKEDAAIYHFRIATQARRLQMTQPFIVTPSLDRTADTIFAGPVAVAHNGIISCATRAGEAKFSDTAIFDADILSRLIGQYSYERDLKNETVAGAIKAAGGSSKFAFLTAKGHIYTVGPFIKDEATGLEFSNNSYKIYRPYFSDDGRARGRREEPAKKGAKSIMTFDDLPDDFWKE